MPSKLQRTLGAVKDQTSIGLAKVSGKAFGTSSALDVAVLKATSHDEVPIEDCHVTEVLLLAATSPVAAEAAVRALSRRISRTHNWVVALKCLNLVSVALRDGGPHFPKAAAEEAVSGSRRRRRRLLDLSNFCDESAASSPWDFTAFVRTFARYLDARVEVALHGKLPSSSHRHLKPSQPSASNQKHLVALLDRVGDWQRLLDRAIATRPTGPARANRLVRASLHSVIREAHALYRHISDALALLLDGFFRLPPAARLDAFRACSHAAKQFEDLDAFYALCKKMGVGRLSEYPAVHKVSATLLEALQEFFSDGQSPPESPLRGLFPAAAAEPPPSNSDGWELVLAESVRNSPGSEEARESSGRRIPQSSNNNPFLDNGSEVSLAAVPSSSSSLSSMASSMQALPPPREEKAAETDSFKASKDGGRSASAERLDARQQLVREQKLWLEQQNKMMQKNVLAT